MMLRSSRIGGRSAQTTGSGICYLIAIDILRIHESRPVFTDAPTLNLSWRYQT